MTTTSYLQLPFQFDTNKLLHDYSLVVNQHWVPHFNTDGYEGEWKAIPLYASNGDASNIFAFLNHNEAILETPIMKNCSEFKKVINTIQCPILSARLLRLGVGAEIKPHRDYKLGYEDGNFRLHIPIITNNKVQFILNNEKLCMLSGECWYTNVNYIHSVSNYGNEDRVHLVIDFERNEWSDKLFFSLASKESFQPIPKKTESPETMRLMIEELKLQNTPAATQLILELEQQVLKLSKE
ncbi:aspartyl/asparaginyl beta-hydroxylase domain-containing protein [Tenacibaculum tangerinum]|uniref:Aspartyl/asparaginyl beta-hydroxylase domain-containing protein n=1 Tax=Tenacibaculum tangerinum TaxID=3038772 RepID=A0ABY8L590_9FLAO|nr:aspartyl/asparaginyl beta-hydroxylase domain-containing protein [Tenacibaculum tangerinum]WGH76583.1 aspartyl/asparaginyl beta-hydroxylase domain-containing protein [Tenacibaculum tangerinum]